MPCQEDWIIEFIGIKPYVEHSGPGVSPTCWPETPDIEHRHDHDRHGRPERHTGFLGGGGHRKPSSRTDAHFAGRRISRSSQWIGAKNLSRSLSVRDALGWSALRPPA